jgi:DNA-binding beta-propeller fold protein YncE
MRLLTALFLTLAAALPASAAPALKWQVTQSIPIDAVAVDLVKDPTRPCLYALNRKNSEVLFIDLATNKVQRLYVGKLPTSLAISRDASKLYVANRGTGSNTPGGYQIAVVDLTTRTKLRHFLTTYQPVNIVCGAHDRLYYNDGSWEAGNIHDSSGSTGVVDLTTETDLGLIGQTGESWWRDGFTIKSRMVMNPEGTKLFGQYVYEGNLGEMGVFDVETPKAFLLDRHPYSPYPYGWDYNNYAISDDGNRLAYGHILFNANDLLIQYGTFPELIHALDAHGRLAFGTNTIWDTSTFATTGDATPLARHDLASSVMTFDPMGSCLYAYSLRDASIKKMELAPEPPPLPPATPDASVSAHVGKSYVGAGIFNSNASKQTITNVVRRGKSKKFYARVVNTTSTPGQMGVIGPAGTANFPISYYDSKGKNITSKVIAGTYRTASLGSAATFIEIRVRAASKLSLKAKTKIRLDFESISPPYKQDSVAISLTTAL